MRPEAEDEQQIEALIAEQVHQKLQVILEGEMANALHDFVDKVSPFPNPTCSVLLDQDSHQGVDDMSLREYLAIGRSSTERHHRVPACSRSALTECTGQWPGVSHLSLSSVYANTCRCSQVITVLAGACRCSHRSVLMQDDKQALASCVQRSLETVHRAVVGSTPSDRGGVADNEMVALLDRHLVERRSTHQVTNF